MMMRGHIILIAATALGLAACSEDSGMVPFDPGFEGPELPAGTEILEDAVDGLTVGHRLMASGEFELALRAYYRAGAEQGINVDVLSALGSANLRLARLGQAERLLRQALDLDPEFVPALNNLGVVLMERGEYGEARRVFEMAFSLDSGRTDAIRENLRLAIARMENAVYAGENQNDDFGLIRRGPGYYALLVTP